MQIKAVVFDLYGVLGLNGWQAFKRLHFTDNPESWEHLRALGQRVDAGKASEEELVVAVAQATGESAQTIRYQFEHTVPNEELLHYIAAALKPRYKIGLLSNASRDIFGDVFRTEQFALFDTAVSSFHVGMTKPDPRMFMLMCERLGVLPAECIFVDDQVRHLDAARRLGFQTILYQSASQVKQAIGEVLTA